MTTTKIELVTIEHNGFHGLTAVRFRPVGEAIVNGVEYWTVMPRVGRRLNDAACGMSGCRCGEEIAWTWQTPPIRYYVSKETSVRGRYPQS